MFSLVSTDQVDGKVSFFFVIPRPLVSSLNSRLLLVDWNPFLDVSRS